MIERVMAHPNAVDALSAWLFPSEQRIRGIDLPEELADKPREHARLELASLEVGPGEQAVVDAIPRRPFLVDTIRIAKEVAGSFKIEAIYVGNLAQTRPGEAVSAVALSPEAHLPLLDWCPPGVPVRLSISNVGAQPAVFRCVVEGEQVADPGPQPIEVPLQCLYQRCKNEGRLRVRPSHGGYNIWPEPGWVFYALGFPSERRNLGVCPDHQNITIPASGAGASLDVVVRQETHGVYYEIREAGVVLGKATFPTNTLQLQFAPRPEGVSDRLLDAGRRVAVTSDSCLTPRCNEARHPEPDGARHRRDPGPVRDGSASPDRPAALA
jgi:hypothetical protein